jgi:formylglycine-generating enzyme required for sulfatase activity
MTWVHSANSSGKLVKLTILLAGTLLLNSPLHAQPTELSATLTPTVIINGPSGSLQQVQYSTNPADSNSWVILDHVRLGTLPTPYFDFNTSGEKRFYRTLLMGVADTNLVWIPGGTFLMGTPDTEAGRGTNEGPQTMVTLTKGFFIGRFEVRNSEWMAIFTNVPFLGDELLTNYLERPVRNIRWEQAKSYCALKTALDLEAGRIPAGWEYTLPTEAQWEYACRAGTTSVFHFGNEIRRDAIRQDAAFLATSPYPTNLVPVNPIFDTPPMPVGSFSPNAFGLYDMHGNLEEWCLDIYPVGPLQQYPGGSVADPFGTNTTGAFVLRGGATTLPGTDCRSGFRRGRTNPTPSFTFGFRIVLVKTSPD